MNTHSLKQKALNLLGNIEYGRLLLTMPDGSSFEFSGSFSGTAATLHIHDWRTFKALALKGDIGFAECFRDGLCDTPDLINLIQFSLENEKALQNYIHGSLAGRIMAFISNFLKMNTISGSRKNIHAHYDLGNSFYKLWLDPSMTYSSAIFESPEENLLSAQNRKYDRIIDKLESNSGRILEIGCGWGGFANRALQRGDFDIKGVTLSDEQHAYANNMLSGSANIALEDYRHQKGKYDFIVSIEMFEAVGERYWPTYFNKLKELISHGGKAIIQTITIDENHFDRYRSTGDFIRSYIFPGGMLPCAQRFELEALRAGLKTTDQFSFGKDYARTLKHWLDAFDKKQNEVLALGFDTAFIRIWRLYLAACIASFSFGRTNVMQMELQHV